MSKIERQVMASVGVIWGARQLISPVALKCYALFISGVALWQLTFVHRVFENWANVGFSGTWSFVTYAILHTHIPVQIALVVAACAGASLLLDAIRSLRHQRPSLLLPL